MAAEQNPTPNFNQPLAEVFGYLPTDMRSKAATNRVKKTCPFTQQTCTKVSVEDPLGVCSVNKETSVVITCPNRFREDWLIAKEAAGFFFPAGAKWAALSEIRLKDEDEESAGNIDLVLVMLDANRRIVDFGALEVQAVYISGNVRNPFAFYMEDPAENATMDWRGEEKYPRPDFLSSSRKRLAPQLLTKGGIIHSWGKKSAVALDSHFFNTLPTMKQVSKEEGEIAWLVYDLVLAEGRYKLTKTKVAYTRFEEALLTITKKTPGNASEFVSKLHQDFKKRLVAWG